MTAPTKNRVERRAQRALEQKFRRIFEESPDYITVNHWKTGRFVEVNRSFERLTGYPAIDVIGRTPRELAPLFEASALDALVEAMQRDGIVRDRELSLQTRAGAQVTCICTVSLIELDGARHAITIARDVTEERRAERALLVSRDVTERKQAELEVRRLNAQLEQRVAERTRDLEAANRELEAFSYSVAHDLRAPLRAILGFSTLLTDENDSTLGAVGQQHLKRIIEGAERMSGMIEALLTLSRLMRVELHRSRVSLSDLARTIAAELVASAPQRRVELTIEDGIEVDGDARLLRLLLENLLGNAWKYTSRKPAARIEFGALPPAGSLRSFYVRDDGAGFDPVYAGRLFGVFQRLHGAGEFPGHGVGLSTVKRVAERHGGRVWAEGKPGRGATFYFELPVPASAA